MKPGRELDLLVAEKVMGYPDNLIADVKADGSLDEDGELVPYYSTDISAAWEVVEKINGEWKFFIDSDNNCTVASRKYQDNSLIELEGDTAPHAICNAALKARGMEACLKKN